MFAYEIPGLRFSLPAGGVVARRRFVMVNASGLGVLATAGGQAIGVSMNETKVDEALEIADGIVMVESSAAITSGDSISVADGGKAVKATAGESATIVVGIAITAATAADQLVAVKLI